MVRAGAARDMRIDMIRGLALVMIFVNHIPGNPLSTFTLASWGFSDAAEVFVLLAGVASALAYGRYFNQGRIGAGIFAIASRITRLYFMHLVLFIGVAGLCVYAAERLNDPAFLEMLGFDVFLQAPAGFIGNVLSLTFLPAYLDILPLYIVLLAFLPLLFVLASRHWALPLAASLAVYLAAHYWSLNLPNTRTASQWWFNPLAWQLLFVIGFSIGRHMQTGRGFAGLGLLAGPMARRGVTIMAGMLTLAGFLLVAPWREWPALENFVIVNPGVLATFAKTDLHPVRLIDILAKAWLVMIFVPAASGWVRSAPARFLAQMGRHSLEVFALATVLSVAGGITASAFGYQGGVVLAINLVGIGAMGGLAAAIEWHRRATSEIVGQAEGHAAIGPAPESGPRAASHISKPKASQPSGSEGLAPETGQ